MNRKRVGLALLSLFFVCQAWATPDMGWGEFRIVTQSPNSTGEPLSLDQPRRCAVIFRNVGVAHILDFQAVTRESSLDDSHQAEMSARVNIDQPSEMGVTTGAGASIRTVPTSRPAPLHRRLFAEAMSQWRDHGYNQAQISLLSEIDAQLSPNRVHWVQFRLSPEDLPEDMRGAEFGLASIRIFDASQPGTRIMGYPVRSQDRHSEGDPTNLNEALSPIELSPRNIEAGYFLPNRPQGQVRPVYMWHIGVGTNIKTFGAGLLVMFGHVARLLDMHYNRQYFATYGLTDPVDEISMQIISSAKADLVPYYRKLGFEVLDAFTMEPAEPVFIVDQNGETSIQTQEARRLPDGMVLIGMSASTFLQRYFEMADSPNIEIETERAIYRIGASEDDQLLAEMNRALRARNQRVLRSARPIHDVARLREMLNNNRDELVMFRQALDRFLRSTPELASMDRPEAIYFRNHQGYQNLREVHTRFATGFARIIYSLPLEWRNFDWPILEDYALMFLSQTPLEVLQKEERLYDRNFEGFRALDRLLQDLP